LAGKILGFVKANNRPGRGSRGRDLLSLFPHLFFKIFAVENIPFAASWRYVTRKRKDLLADYFVDRIFSLKKVM
jgi:hypothetical protein